jgi:hypothetical protein
MSEQEATNPVGGVAEAPEAPAQEHIPETQTETPELAEGEHPEAPVEDLEDIELEGKQYRVPKDLKDGYLRQADYTRKTQEVAEQRKAVEEREKAFQDQARLHQEHIEAIADLRALDKQIEKYRNYDWRGAYAQASGNQEATRELDAHRLQYDMLKDERQTIADTLTQKAQQRAFEAQRESARQFEQAEAVLKREIPGWSAETRDKLKDFAISKGVPARDVAQVTNPAIVKILHLAYLGEQSLTKARAAAKPAAPVATPVPTVSARQSPRVDPNPSDKDDAATWLRKREAQLRKQEGR